MIGEFGKERGPPFLGCRELGSELFQLAVDPLQLGPRLLFPEVSLTMPGADQILDLTAEQPQPRVPVHRAGPVLELARADRLDEAWAAAMANPGQVPESQWFQLIEVREKNHPADVIRPYQDLIEIGLERASDKYRYPKAVKTIRRLQGSYQRAGDEAGFTAYLADLRQRHRRKTSFIAKLDKALAR